MTAPATLVVGGGVIGAAIAYRLARAGGSVALLERDEVGAHASGAAAGMLSPVGETVGEGPVCSLGAESLALLAAEAEELATLSGVDPELTRSGSLRLVTAAELGGLRARRQALAALGCEWLECDELAKREPRLAGWPAGIFAPGESHVDPLALTRAFARAGQRRGVRVESGVVVTGLIREGERVIGVHTSAGDRYAADVVLCCGAWSRAAEPWLDRPLPIDPVKGQMLALEGLERALPFIVWGPGAYLVPRRNGRVRVGATVEHVGFDVRPTGAGVATLLAGAFELIAELGGCRFHSTWAGLRPGTPDDLPLVGPLAGIPGLTIAAGHGRNGVLLCALTAAGVADWLLEGRRSELLERSDPNRFGARR